MKSLRSILSSAMILALCSVFSFAQLAPKSDSGAFDADTQSKLDAAFKEMKNYKEGVKDDGWKLIESAVVAAQVSKEKRAFILPRLTDLFKPDTTIECKRFAAKQMLLVGTEESAKALAGLLTDAEASAPALYALERIPGEGISAILRDALPKASGKIKAGIINSLGQRRDAKAASAMGPALGDSDPMIAKAAALALGNIGTVEAADALTAARVKAPEALLAPICDGLLLCADQMARNKGQEAKAAAIYETLTANGKPDYIRGAAFRGLVTMKGDKGPAMLVEALKGKDAALIPAAVALVRELPSNETAQTAVYALAKLPVERQPLVIYALADRDAYDAREAVLEACKSTDDAIRVAALTALARIGGNSAVAVLVKAACDPKTPRERDVARDSLDRLRGVDIEYAMLNALVKAEAPERVELIRSLGARAATKSESVNAMMKAANDENADVRKEALKSLGVVAGGKNMPALVEFLIKAQTPAERTSAEALVVVVARKIADENKRPEAALKALDSATQRDVRCALISAVGKIGSPAGLAALKAAAADKDEDVKKAGIRAMSDWPTDAPLADLRETLAKNSSNAGLRGLALQGCARLVGLPSERGRDETAKILEEMMSQAQTDGEKKTVLSALGKVRHPRALELAQAQAANKALQAEARMAVDQVQKLLSRPYDLSASCSDDRDVPANAMDGDIKTRWGTGKGQEKGQWFQIDLGQEQPVDSITLDAGSSKGDYPREYEVFVSNSVKDWGEPVAKGTGKDAVTQIKCKPKKGRYIRIVQNGAAGSSWWSIYELKINGK
ncbi:MAG: HEAT repeat domain-containing protein [Candidatus Sumerlaeota bacterium]|nr:HEAT repeat domain-containing protein [Candidatus Sumerlaeota bacterium]